MRRELSALPLRLQGSRIRPCFFPGRIRDLQQISALAAAEILPGGIAETAAGNAAELEILLTHSFDRTGDQSHGFGLALSPQILIGLINPVLARRSEYVEIDGVFQCLGLVRHVRRN